MAFAQFLSKIIEGPALLAKRFVHFFLVVIFTAPARDWLAAYRLRSLSCSQLHQDVFVLILLNFKRNGFFVEFGACDGRYLSNTYLLERFFGWSGVLSEPTRRWHHDLVLNREKSVIDRRCIWRVTGASLEFNEREDAALSGLGSFGGVAVSDCSFKVETVSLEDLLRQSNSPRQIDFLSIDTEGSEWDIIQGFDFNSFDIRVVCIEHNYREDRKKIREKMLASGYSRKLRWLSRFDDWYVKG